MLRINRTLDLQPVPVSGGGRSPFSFNDTVRIKNPIHMKTVLQLLAVVITFTLAGCGPDSSGSASGFEGTYVEVDNPDISLRVKGNTWRQGASDIYADCTFTAQKINDNAWRVDLTYHNKMMDLEGHKSTVILRKDGDFVFVRDEDSDYETKFKRK